MSGYDWSDARMKKFAVYAGAVTMCGFAVFYLLVPAALVTRRICDPGLMEARIPGFAFDTHRALSPQIERWARSRVEGSAAGRLSVNDISGTEWPLFSAVFYLDATRCLHTAWQSDPGLAAADPLAVGRGAVEAVAELLADPAHAKWVRDHYGDEYLTRENVFYRMLLIWGFTDYYRLTGDARYNETILRQVESLSAEIDGSVSGLLNDYPGECYPGDVLAGIRAIKIASDTFGLDKGAFVERARRAFVGRGLSAEGLPAYASSAASGLPLSCARGCSNSYVLLTTPDVWPDLAAGWYEIYEREFWQSKWGAWAFREFPRGADAKEWHFDVDAGPVLAGHGFAAAAFGIGAARRNGRFDHAYPLTLEALAVGMPLACNVLLFPRLLSNAVDAPFIGEISILYCLTRLPDENAGVVTGGGVPPFVHVCIGLYVFGALLFFAGARSKVARFTKNAANAGLPFARLQIVVWGALLVAGAVAVAIGNAVAGTVTLLFALLFPFYRIHARQNNE